jgi:hypothetical protein
LILLVLLACSANGEAQYFSTGSDPGSLKWSHTVVGKFNLVFPKNETRLAHQFSNILSDISGPVTASMKADIRSIPLIMHPYTCFSNGSSILAPRRIELYPKQPIALETNDFLSQLAIHEVRHFAQMDMLNNGFTRAAGLILGEQAQSVVLGLYVPKWLLEGDAVLTETLLSYGGRGRIATFIQPLRSRLIDHKDLSWDRVVFGSYRETLPNEYLMGYFLTARGRMMTDPMLWSDALKKIGRNPFNVRGLSGITRPNTGYRFSKLYVETMQWLRDYWTDPALTVEAPEGLFVLAGDTLEYSNYYRPQKMNDGQVVCLKRSMSDLPAFVSIDSMRNERRITRPGNIEDAGFSYCDGKLIWAEMIQDPRWENRGWSDIFLYNLPDGSKTRLTRRQRYFSPVFSPAGDRIGVISEEVDGTSFLRILDATDGHVLKSIQAQENDHFSYICWGNAPEELFAITTGREGRKLIRADLSRMVGETILVAGMIDIACPAIQGDRIYFTGPAGATQGLFSIDRKSRKIRLVFAHPHGINYLNFNGQDLFLSAYSSSGYRPARISTTNLTGKPVTRVEPLNEPVTSIIQRAENEFPVVYSDTSRTFQVEPYRKVAHLLRLHSWSPIFLNPDKYMLSPGVVLMSQNDLSTLTCWGGYQWNKTDLSNNLLASVRYTGFYPSLEMNISRKYRNPAVSADSAGRHVFRFPSAYWQFLHFGATVPLDFSSGAWNRRMEPGLFFEKASDLLHRHDVINESAWMAGISFSASSLRKTSYRDLFPKWGMSMNFSYFKAFNTLHSGNNLAGRITAYLPGFLPNSSLRILNSAYILTFDQFYNSVQDFPRGQVVLNPRNRYNLKVDYAFPILYPDYHLSWLIYVNRIKADLFFDAGSSLDVVDWFMSTGLDLTFDYRLVRSGIRLESGIRLMYFPTTRKIGAELLYAFSVN